MSEETGRFLARWAKRKAQARRGELPKDELPKAAPAATVTEPSGQTGELQADAGDEVAPDLNLPSIEELGPGSDFKPFMAQGVPVDVKNQALKKLWASNPLYNHIDMLDDYCEDYTDAACAVPGVKTAYQIGRGFVKEMTESGEDTTKVETADGETPAGPAKIDENAEIAVENPIEASGEQAPKTV